MPVLTISRQMGSLGDEIAQALASRLGWDLIDRNQLISRFFADNLTATEKQHLNNSARFYLNQSNYGCSYIEYLEQELFALTRKQSLIMLGFGSQVIFAEDSSAFHVRVIAATDVRINRVRKQFRVSEIDAQKILQTADKKHRRFVSIVFNTDLTDNCLYDLILNTTSLNAETCTTLLMQMIREKEQLLLAEKMAEQEDVILKKNNLPTFKNESETEFARILDMYQIEWKYEPRTFPVEWDAEGNITLAFSPDFYLPEFDTYIELTTMNQRYVTMKNRKARKARELYPDVNIKIVYKKDFQSLVERFSERG